MAMEGKPFLKLRPLTEEDIPAAAEICLEAFNTFNASVGLPQELPSVEPLVGMMTSKVMNPFAYCVLAMNEKDQPIGSNFISGDPDSGVWCMGPVTVSTRANNSGVGKAIVKACVEKAEERGAKSLRLLQIVSNTKSFSLYSKFDFEPEFVVAHFEGYPKQPLTIPSGYTVERLQKEDIPGCDALFSASNGYSIAKILSEMLEGWPFPMFVAKKEANVVAYTTAFSFIGHTVARTDEAFIALFTGASKQLKSLQAPPPSFHLPVASAPNLNRWCLSIGLRIVRQAWVMVKGDFPDMPREPLYCPGIDWQ